MSNVDYRLSELQQSVLRESVLRESALRESALQEPELQEEVGGFGSESDVDRACRPGVGNDGRFDDMLEQRVRNLEVALASVETALHPLAAKSDVVEVKDELATAESRLIKWIIGSAFAAAATMIAFLNYTKPAMAPAIGVPPPVNYSAPQTGSPPEQ